MDRDIIDNFNDGREAIAEFNVNWMRESLDSVIDKVSPELNFKGTAGNFRSKVLEFTNIASAGTPAVMSFLNKNKYMASGARFVDEYLRDNPEQAMKIAADIEEEIGISFADVGLDKTVYDSFMHGLKKKGLVGVDGALHPVVDALMRNFPVISESFVKNAGNESFRGITMEQILTMGRDKFGITSEGIRGAYLDSGFNGDSGVFNHIIRSLVVNGSESYSPFFDSVGMTPEGVIGSYDKGGLFGREGLAETAVGFGLGIPRIEEILYSKMVGMALADKKKKLSKTEEDMDNVLLRMLHNDRLNDEIQRDNRKLMMMGVHMSLEPERLAQINLEHGLFGEQGVLGYLAACCPLIFREAVDSGILTDDNVRSSVESTLRGLSLGPEGIKKYFKSGLDASDLKPGEKFAIAVGRDSHYAGVSPMEYLSEDSFFRQRRAAIVDAYGSIPEFFQKRSKIYTGAEELSALAIKSIEDGELDRNEILEAVTDKFRPDNKFLGMAFDRLAKNYIKRTFVQRVSDYAVLTNALAKHELARNDESLIRYNTF